MYDLQYACTDFTGAAARTDHSADDAFSTCGGYSYSNDGLVAGQGSGDSDGTQASTDMHSGASVCPPSDSIRVYHASDSRLPSRS